MGWGVGWRGNWETAGATGESIVQHHVEVKGGQSFGERRIRGKGSLETRAEGCDDERATHEASEGTFPSGLGKGDRWWAWLGLGKKRLQTDLHLSRLPWWLRGYSAGDLGSIPRSEVPLEEGTATHSSTLAWRIPWMEEPGGSQSMGSQRVRHD